jgi:hypothetical protein
MGQIELDVLRVRCMTALHAYQTLAAKVFGLAEAGDRPSAPEIDAEEKALYEYASVRRQLLDALAAPSKPR